MKIGVIGLGSIGMRHARNALEEGAEVLGFDPDEDRQSLLTEAGGKIAATQNDLLSQCDAIVIGSPNRFHKDNLLDCIEAGCHVLVEKPLSVNMAGIGDILEQAAEKKLIIAAAMNLRFHTVVKESFAVIQNGELGRPLWARFTYSGYLPNWRPHQDYRAGYTTDPTTGGVIFDIIHEFDLAYYLCGPATTKSCTAWQSGTIESNAEDSAEILLAHESGAHSSIHIDYASPNENKAANNQRRFEIQLEKGNIRGDLLAREIIVHDDQQEIIRKEVCIGGFDQDYRDEMKNFIAAINGQTPPACSGYAALDVLRTVIDARKMADLPQAA